MEKKIKDKRNAVAIVIIVLCIIAAIIVAAVMLFGETGKEPAKTEVFRVGDEVVCLDEINFCIYQNVTSLNIDSKALTAKPSSGGSADDYYKEEILKMIMDYKVEYLVAKSKGITISEDEEKRILSDVASYMQKSDGRAIRELGIEKECIQRIYRERFLAHKLEESVTKDIEVDSQRYCTIYAMLFPKVEMDENGDYIREADGETPILLSEEEIKEMKNKADDALKDLKAGDGEAEVAEKYGVALYSGEESNLVESFGEPFSKYVTSLKEGEISPVLETESCYAIVKMLDENNQEVADHILSYYKADLEKETLESERKKWYQETGVKEKPEMVSHIWDKITLYDFVKYVEE